MTPWASPIAPAGYKDEISTNRRKLRKMRGRRHASGALDIQRTLTISVHDE